MNRLFAACRANGVMLQIPLSQDAEKLRQHRSRFGEIFNGDPAASPLGGAHRLGAPYSSHREFPKDLYP
jgi:hypothetical protein